MALTRIKNTALDPSTDITADQLDVGPLGGRRNLIINGGFDVWQRGESFTGLGGPNWTFAADRWRVSTKPDGVNTDIYKGTDTINGEVQNYIHTFNSGWIYQDVENVNQFVGKTFTLSFYAKADATMDINLAGGGTHGSGAGITSVTQTIGTANLTTSWQKFTFTWDTSANLSGTATIPYDSYYRIQFNNSVSTNNVYLAQVQLEVGSVATPFEHRSYGEELALCQRYFYDTRDLTDSTGSNNYMELQGTRHRFADVIGYRGQTYTHPVIMRTTPTITAYNPNNSMTSGQVQYYAADGSTQNIGPGIWVKKHAMYFWNYTGVSVGTTGQSVVCNVHWTADAEL